MEAASVIEVIIQNVHRNAEESWDLPKSLLVTSLNPMAHITETKM